MNGQLSAPCCYVHVHVDSSLLAVSVMLAKADILLLCDKSRCSVMQCVRDNESKKENRKERKIERIRNQEREGTITGYLRRWKAEGNLE